MAISEAWPQVKASKRGAHSCASSLDDICVALPLLWLFGALSAPTHPLRSLRLASSQCVYLLRWAGSFCPASRMCSPATCVPVGSTSHLCLSFPSPPFSVCECFASRFHFCFRSSTLSRSLRLSLYLFRLLLHPRTCAHTHGCQPAGTCIGAYVEHASFHLSCSCQLLIYSFGGQVRGLRMCACSIRFFPAFLSLRLLRPYLSPVLLSRCVRSFVFTIPPSAIPPPRSILYRTPHSPCLPSTSLAEQRPSVHLSCLALTPLPDAKGSECSVHALSLSWSSVL